MVIQRFYKLLLQTMYQTDYDYVFKILLIGDSSVGKSSLLLKFAEDIFAENFLPTIGVDFKIRTIEAAGSLVKLQMWDTAGQQKFKTITSAYYKGAHGILLVYDITNRKSFEDLSNWICQAEKYSRENVVKILVGNKKDLEAQREVTSEQGKKLAESLEMEYFETSAKEGFNIEETFVNLVIKMKKIPNARPKMNTQRAPSLTPEDNNRSSKKQKTCC